MAGKSKSLLNKMKEEIVRKLKSALSEPIEKENQVVYILAEIRKLLDRLGDKKTLPVLRFYSNWVLHIEIDRTSAVQSLLEKIEKTILENQYETCVIMEMVNFDEFRKEIGIFLGKYSIGNPFLEITHWRNFRKILVDILIDCPLKPKYGNIKEFSFVKSDIEGDIGFIIKFKNNIHTPLKISWNL